MNLSPNAVSVILIIIQVVVESQNTQSVSCCGLAHICNPIHVPQPYAHF
jgi:hypothetical protein